MLALSKAGLMIILDNHMSNSDWCCSDTDGFLSPPHIAYFACLILCVCCIRQWPMVQQGLPGVYMVADNTTSSEEI